MHGQGGRVGESKLSRNYMIKRGLPTRRGESGAPVVVRSILRETQLLGNFTEFLLFLSRTFKSLFLFNNSEVF